MYYLPVGVILKTLKSRSLHGVLGDGSAPIADSQHPVLQCSQSHFMVSCPADFLELMGESAMSIGPSLARFGLAGFHPDDTAQL